MVCVDVTCCFFLFSTLKISTHSEQSVLLAAVEPVHDDHQARTVAQEAVHTARHLTEQLHLPLQVLHKTLHLERLHVRPDPLHAAAGRHGQVDDHAGPGVRIADKDHSDDNGYGDKRAVHGCVAAVGDAVKAEDGNKDTSGHDTEDDQQHDDEVGDAADGFEPALVLRGCRVGDIKEVYFITVEIIIYNYTLHY